MTKTCSVEHLFSLEVFASSATEATAAAAAAGDIADIEWQGPWFSASQVSTFQLCARKWAWQKVEGLRSPPGPAAALGTEVHEQLELWLAEGRPLDMTTEAGRLAMELLYLLPAPCTPGMVVEELFGLEIGGHRFKGFKDWQILQRDPPIVGDHKTTIDLRWAKSADDLRTDVQACLYAADAMHRTGAAEAELHWNYTRTRGAKTALPVRLRVTRDDVTPTLERAVRSCDEMTLILASGVTAREVPPNANACEAFGGCEFQGLCNLTPEERMRAIMTQAQTSQDFLSRLQSRAQGVNPPPLAAAPPQATNGVPPYQSASNGAPPPPVAAAAPPQPVWNGTAWVGPDGAPIAIAPPVQAAPPPAPPQPVWNGSAWVGPDGAPIAIAPAPQAAPPPVPAPAIEPGPAATAPTRRRRAAAAAAQAPAPAAAPPEAYPPQPAVAPYPPQPAPHASPAPAPQAAAFTSRDALLALAASLEAQAQVLRTLAA